MVKLKATKNNWEPVDSMAKEIIVPSDVWFFVGNELLKMGYINPEISISAVVNEPKIKWVLLEKEEWEAWCSILNLVDANPIEHKGEEDIDEWVEAFNFFVKETLKNKQMLSQFPKTEPMIKALGWEYVDNVVIMSANRTEETFKRTEEYHIRFLGTPFYFNTDCCRFAVLIHELIHSYEYMMNKPIIRDTIDTESMLQNEIMLNYLAVRSMHPSNFKLTYC